MSMYSTGLDAMADKMKTTSSSRASSKAEEQGVAAAAGPEALAAVAAAKMRCGGCGGKVCALLHLLLWQLCSCFVHVWLFQLLSDFLPVCFCLGS